MSIKSLVVWGIVSFMMVVAAGSCSSCSSSNVNTGKTADDGGGGGGAGLPGSGNAACDYQVGASLYGGEVSGDGEQTRTTDETSLIQPSDLSYVGAFRLPGPDGRDGSFSYGGNAMTYYPPNGTLFITGHDRIPYGEFPQGSRVAEVSIPTPVNSRTVGDLPTATFVQNFADVTGVLFDTYDELPRIGLAYASTPDAGGRIYLAWGQHFHESDEDAVPSHASFSADLSAPDAQGAWYVGDRSLYSTNGYMFEIPQAFADAHLGGRSLATGRYRDGGWSGQGPALYAIAPWQDGSPPANCTQLSEVALLQYAASTEDDDITATMNGYQHADEWEGGAWLTRPDGRAAVIFVGTKGTGNKYWYGWINPAGPAFPCIEVEFRDEYTTCRNADGTPCPAADLNGCEGHNDYRGWWSERFDAQIIFYDPANLAAVVAGTMAPSVPQPYAILDIDDQLLLPVGVEDDMIGTGQQRRYRIGAVAFDRDSGRLYVLELFADQAKPIVHVWQVN